MRKGLVVSLAAACLFVFAAPSAAASSIGRVTEISGSAMIMRGNKVERLYVGSTVEKGDKIIVQGGGQVKLSSGDVIGPGTSSISKGKSGAVDIVTTSSSASSSSNNAKSNKSKLFSNASGKSNKKDNDDKDDKDDYRDRDDDDGRGGRDDDDDDDDDEDDGKPDGYPHDPKPVSLY